MANYYLGVKEYSDGELTPIENIKGSIISLVDETSKYDTIEDLKTDLLRNEKINNLRVNLYYLKKEKNQFVIVNNRETVVLKDNNKYYHSDGINEIFNNNLKNLDFIEKLFYYYMKKSKTIYKIENNLKDIIVRNPSELFDVLLSINPHKYKAEYLNKIRELRDLYNSNLISRVKLLENFAPIIKYVVSSPLLLADVYYDNFKDNTNYKVPYLSNLSEIVNLCYKLTTTNGFSDDNPSYEMYHNTVNRFIYSEIHGRNDKTIKEDYKTVYDLGNFLESMFGKSYEPLKLDLLNQETQMNLFSDFNLSTDANSYVMSNELSKEEIASLEKESIEQDLKNKNRLENDATYYKNDDSDEEFLTEEDFNRYNTDPSSVGYIKR